MITVFMTETTPACSPTGYRPADECRADRFEALDPSSRLTETSWDTDGGDPRYRRQKSSAQQILDDRDRE
jgi:hypothetical protein